MTRYDFDFKNLKPGDALYDNGNIKYFVGWSVNHSNGVVLEDQKGHLSIFFEPFFKDLGRVPEFDRPRV